MISFCSSANHNPEFRCVICTGVTLELHCSQPIRMEYLFSMYIINVFTTGSCRVRLLLSLAGGEPDQRTSFVFVFYCFSLISFDVASFFSGISEEKTLNPVQLASLKAERIAREKATVASVHEVVIHVFFCLLSFGSSQVQRINFICIV